MRAMILVTPEAAEAAIVVARSGRRASGGVVCRRGIGDEPRSEGECDNKLGQRSDEVDEGKYDEVDEAVKRQTRTATKAATKTPKKNGEPEKRHSR